MEDDLFEPNSARLSTEGALCQAPRVDCVEGERTVTAVLRAIGAKLELAAQGGEAEECAREAIRRLVLTGKALIAQSRPS